MIVFYYMDVQLSKKQLLLLLKLVYLGNWIVNAFRTGTRGDEEVDDFEQVTQYIYEIAHKAGLSEYIEYDQEAQRFFPTLLLEDESDAAKYRRQYDEETFWHELMHRLADRDFACEYTEKEIKAMTDEELIHKQQPFIDHWSRELEKFGVDRLDIFARKVRNVN